METLKQVIKYGIVGAGNTLITAAVIWVMMEVLDYSSILSNVTGYAAGLINSFIWNKQWTFRSNAGWSASAVRFGLAWGVCYLLQLGLLASLEAQTMIRPYFIQLIAMAFFTVLNFVANKFFTFKK